MLTVLATASVAARAPIALGISSERSTDLAAINDYKASTGAKPHCGPCGATGAIAAVAPTASRASGPAPSRPSSPAGFGAGVSRPSSGGSRPIRPSIGATPARSRWLRARTPATRIIKGKHDKYIRDWAKAAKAYGKPVIVRFAHEMNGDWFPWSICDKNGNTPKAFKAAWRHIVGEFRSVGARNVKFLWSPYTTPRAVGTHRSTRATRTSTTSGVTSLNWGNERWRPLSGLLERPMKVLQNVSRTSGNPKGKPVILPEVGSNAPRRRQARLDPRRLRAGVQEVPDHPGHGLLRLNTAAITDGVSRTGAS